MTTPALIRKARETAESTGCSVISAVPNTRGVSVQLVPSDLPFLAADLFGDVVDYPDGRSGFTWDLDGVPVSFWAERARVAS